MGIPAGLTVYKEPFLRLVAAEDILDGASHHVVDTGLAIGTRGTVVEHKRRMSLAEFLSFLESLVLLPVAAHILPNLGQIKLLILFVCHIIIYLFIHTQAVDAK